MCSFLRWFCLKSIFWGLLELVVVKGTDFGSNWTNEYAEVRKYYKLIGSFSSTRPQISDALTGSYNLGTLGVYLDKSDHNLSIRTQWGAYSSTSLFILDVATQSQKDHKLFTTTYNLCSKKKRQWKDVRFPISC